MIRRCLSVFAENRQLRLAALESSLTAGSAPREGDVGPRAGGVRVDAPSGAATLLAKPPIIWLRRACFRAKLRADLKEDLNLLRDIGISVHEAQAESMRFFWEPVVLARH